MADFRAIHGVSEGVMQLLRSNYRREDFGTAADFRVFTARDFASNTISNGVSLFVYRVFCNGIHRIPAGRIDRDGRRRQTLLPIEVHFLLTVWANDASLQHTLAGWMMRTIEDSPSIPANVLNSVAQDIFRDDEGVDICLAELRTEDLFRIWDVLGKNYQLSIPYVARIINIESDRAEPDEGPPVQHRSFGDVLRERV